VQYQLIRSNRKTLSIQIDSNASIVIRAPQKLSINKIEEFVNDKSNWIAKKQSLAISKNHKAKYLTNEDFLYLGNTYKLIVNTNTPYGVEFNGDKFYLNGDGHLEFNKWYKQAFNKIAIPRLEFYSEKYNLQLNNVRIKAQKTLWGSCSSTNNINLNYLLIMAPIATIDYVIVHELCHTKIKNHSKEFWQMLEKILPNYKSSKKWLKVNGHKLHNL